MVNLFCVQADVLKVVTDSPNNSQKIMVYLFSFTTRTGINMVEGLDSSEILKSQMTPIFSLPV